MNLFRKDDETVHRAPPLDDFLAEGIPGKDTVGVGQDKAVDGQVTSNGQQAVRVSPVRVRKSQSFCQLEKPMVSKLLENTQLIVFGRYRDVTSLLQRAKQNLTQ